jgi:hypothetical protein
MLFHIAPAAVRPIWFYLPIGVLVLVIGFASTLLLSSMRGATKASFELNAEGLRLRGDVYGRFIPANEPVPERAERVDIRTGAMRPAIRTVGTAVPGYRAGWFRLANGEKALLYVTDPQRVVHIPTTAGYSLLLSVAETDQFVQQMHTLAHP